MEEITRFLDTFHDSCKSSISLLDSILYLQYDKDHVTHSATHVKSIITKYSMLMNELMLQISDPDKIKEIKEIMHASLEHIDAYKFQESKILLETVNTKVNYLRQSICQ
ncbi:MAG: hypothetical protein ACMXYK_04815 [Candidatus Woesearchaeota archaeon]